jgi:NAD(P)-dependent dehydrogenase (short-subunit alcohol dehydrogenase family)
VPEAESELEGRTGPAPTGLLAGRKALVTGAARGIGLATARRFCEEGAAVVLSDVLPEVEQAAENLREARYSAVAVPFDVTDEAAVQAGITEARERLGRLDTLVANAGVFLDAPLLQTELADFRRVIEINLVGAFLCARAAGRLFAEQGHGTILATASQAGRRGYAGLGAYCASKFGVVGLVESLAKELGPHGVRVCSVAPGMIDTAMFGQVVAGRMERTGESESEVQTRLARLVPVGRLGTPEDVADAFVYLASDLAAHVSGAALVVDGGENS